ncbi:MAG: hypothetical protein R3270_10920 [Gammaproteobacteria bacterium]|nr:hypothetical protein [Gammaproteobacteria bacterium]
MEVALRTRETTQYSGITWKGNGFVEQEAQTLWLRMPANLREITILEMQAGNSVRSILENRDRELVLLEFAYGPLTRPRALYDIHIHEAHDNGNYCYDGTSVTYEDAKTGCFLAFLDPEYLEDSD